MPQTCGVQIKKPPTNTYLEMRDNLEDQFECVDGRSKQGLSWRADIFFDCERTCMDAPGQTSDVRRIWGEEAITIKGGDEDIYYS